MIRNCALIRGAWVIQNKIEKVTVVLMIVTNMYVCIAYQGQGLSEHFTCMSLIYIILPHFSYEETEA